MFVCGAKSNECRKYCIVLLFVRLIDGLLCAPFYCAHCIAVTSRTESPLRCLALDNQHAPRSVTNIIHMKKKNPC